MAFDKIKQLGELNKMRQQAKVLQKQLEEITETYEKGDIKVKVSGDQKIIYIKVDGEDKKDIVDVINKAFKNVQKKSAKKMLESGGGLSGLLGK
jgi:DNA-binding protein YbaB